MTFSISDEWLELASAQFREAAEYLGWMANPWIKDLLVSLAKVTTEPVPDEEFTRLVAAKDSDVPDEDLEELYRDIWRRAVKSSDRDLILKHGRVYHRYTGIPKSLRKYLRIEHNGIREPVSEIDMGSTYWVLLAEGVEDLEERRRLFEYLARGDFYEMIGKRSGASPESLEDHQKLKKAINCNCLFSDRSFGNTPLWWALEGLFPNLARIIKWWRRKDHGATLLSHAITSREGEFFLGRVLNELVHNGVGAIPIHDSVLVPRSVATTCLATMEILAQDQFGFIPRFRLEHLS